MDESTTVFCNPQSNKPLSEGLPHQMESAFGMDDGAGLPSISA